DEVISAALTRVAPAVADVQTDRAAAKEALERIEKEIANLTAAIAAGGELSALVNPGKGREKGSDELRRRAIDPERATERSTVPRDRLRAELTARFSDWTAMLRKQTPVARQILRKLLVGPLRFTPKRGYFEFEGDGTLAKMLANGTHPSSVASPAGFEPAF